MISTTFTKVALASTISLLVACGGGGGGGKKPVSSSSKSSSLSSELTTSSSFSSVATDVESSSAGNSSTGGDGNGNGSGETGGGNSSTGGSNGGGETGGGNSSTGGGNGGGETGGGNSSTGGETGGGNSSSGGETGGGNSSSGGETGGGNSSSGGETGGGNSSSGGETGGGNSSAVSSQVSSGESSVATSSGASSSVSQIIEDAVGIVDPDQYDGEIPLEETQVVGKPSANLQTTGNPFADSYFYINPDIKIMMDQSLAYVNDSNVSAAEKKALSDKIKFVQRQPSAVWMDSIPTISGDPAAGRRSLIDHLDSAVAQQKFYQEQHPQKQLSPMTIVVIVYNLPDRDCAAFASNGALYEIGKPWQWTGELGGMQKYQDDYIGVIKAAFTSKPEYANLRIVTMLEPDSFPNLITNVRTETPIEPIEPSLVWPALTTNGTLTGTPYCQLVKNWTTPGLTNGLGIYGRGLQIAIEELYEAGETNKSYNNGAGNNVYTYLDIGHAGWLGWDDEGQDMSPYSNLKRGVAGFLDLIEGANKGGVDGFTKVRGFATNTSGYTPTEEPAISNREADREILQGFYEWNKSVDEMSYIDNFNARVKTEISNFTSINWQPGFIIDTARNGWGAPNRPTIKTATRGTDVSKRIDKRAHRGHWCNVNNAGVGEVPKPNPDQTRPHLDTFFWMKPPGEADGISFDHTKFAVGSAAYNALDAIDQAIVRDAADPKYEGKALDTMCIEGEIRDGKKAVTPVPAMSPHAGGWFHKQFLMLINNAHPALGTSEYTAK